MKVNVYFCRFNSNVFVFFKWFMWCNYRYISHRIITEAMWYKHPIPWFKLEFWNLKLILANICSLVGVKILKDRIMICYGTYFTL